MYIRLRHIFRSPVLPIKPIHAALSDTGRVRSHNEDAFATNESAGVYVLADGMGGAAAGELASQIAVETFLDFLTRCRSPSGNHPLAPPDTPQTRLHAAILAANRAILDAASTSPHLQGMGTTLIALFHPTPHPTLDTLFLVNVGDSRGYRRRHGALLQISQDHSFVDDQLRAGQITAHQAATSPMRHVLTRALGATDPVESDILSLRPHPGDLYLLASDGLTCDLPDRDIASILDRLIPSDHPTTAHLETACHALVDAANCRGGHDNITVLLLAFPRSIPPHAP